VLQAGRSGVPAPMRLFNFFPVYLILSTASVVLWAELLATGPEVRVLFPALPDFLRSIGSGTGSTQPRDYN
jgi:hypothetical protein